MAGKARVRIYPEQVPDVAANPNYLLQEGFEKRLAEYRRGDFGFCGVRAVAEIEFPSSDGWVIVGRLESPGVWGIEDDSGRDYLTEVFEAEKAILLELFASLREFELVP
jgi:hypothetical protein